ncbi:Catenin-beta-like protein [Catenaria anguillulae PL171]|uniref:Catenin-beta-like protein n=1 Tax=Catenaria anguillulae PL171 TaxID=765915 RepID=A0A1Y2H775_9FUNG|nr:Catenin-beta-like protein [Catenaria anguillulae PL171]
MDFSDIFRGPAPKSLPTSSSALATPAAPSSAHKRKADPSSPPQPPTFRPPKLPRTSSPSRSPPTPAATIDDNNDKDNGDNEEDDPRFFGDGLSSHDRHVLDLVDSAETAIDLTHLDPPALKHLLVRLDKSVLLNQEMRAKYPSDPSKFLASELDLDSDLRAVALLATAPALYRQATQLDAPGKIVGMLAHENPDIALAAVEVLAELLDDDVINPLADHDLEEIDDDQGNSPAEVLEGIRGFVDAMLAADFMSLFESAFRQAWTDAEMTADEKDEALAKYLGLLDALLAVDVTMAARITSDSTLVELLMDLAKGMYGVVSAYAVELIAVVVQNSKRARRKVMVDIKGGMATVLKLISTFRKRDPTDADHAEYLSNLFDILCSSLMTEPKVQRAFREEEGFELMLMLIKARKLARTRAVRVLNYATLPILGQDGDGDDNDHMWIRGSRQSGMPLFCQGGRRHWDQKKLAKAYKADYSPTSDEEHITSVLVNLMRALSLGTCPPSLRADVAECAARVLAKFAEDEHAKLIQLVSRFATTCTSYLDRLERGGFTLNQLGVLLAMVVRESSECGEYCARALLPAARVEVEQLRRVVEASVGRVGANDADEDEGGEDMRGLVEVVQALETSQRSA